MAKAIVESCTVKFDAGSEEALTWAAGFFCGEGWVSIFKSGNSYVGIVGMAQKHLWPLNVVHLILRSHNIIVPEPRYSKGTKGYELNINRSKGSEFLQLIMCYPMRNKHTIRARIYFRMFPPGERYKQRPKERAELYAEWLQLRIQEKGG